MKELTVDHKIHEAMGMRILTNEDVKGLRSERAHMEWPEDQPFDPKGVTLKEAQKTMKGI